MGPVQFLGEGLRVRPVFADPTASTGVRIVRNETYPVVRPYFTHPGKEGTRGWVFEGQTRGLDKQRGRSAASPSPPANRADGFAVEFARRRSSYWQLTIAAIRWRKFVALKEAGPIECYMDRYLARHRPQPN
jgi:hypothetical protein